jgi:SMC interacting uncharacterized protein involved in chromosome segregation
VDNGIIIVVEVLRLKRVRENLTFEKCRTEKWRLLQEDLKSALQQIDELKARNRELEAKLLMAGTGYTDTMSTEQKVTKCVVVVDSILRNV